MLGPVITEMGGHPWIRVTHSLTTTIYMSINIGLDTNYVDITVSPHTAMTTTAPTADDLTDELHTNPDE